MERASLVELAASAVMVLLGVEASCAAIEVLDPVAEGITALALFVVEVLVGSSMLSVVVSLLDGTAEITLLAMIAISHLFSHPHCLIGVIHEYSLLETYILSPSP